MPQQDPLQTELLQRASDPGNKSGQAQAVLDGLPMSQMLTTATLPTNPDGSLAVITRDSGSTGADKLLEDYEEQKRRLLHEFWSKGMLTNYAPGRDEKRDDLVDTMLERELQRRGISKVIAPVDPTQDSDGNPVPPLDDPDAKDNLDEDEEDRARRLGKEF